MTGVLATDGLVPAFIKAFGVTTASEVGDNTFFMVAVMSMKNPWYSVFAAAMLALTAMTLLSCALGWAAPALVSPAYTHYAATVMFFYFGCSTLWEAIRGEEDDDEGLQAAERELKESPARKEKAPSWLPFLSPVLIKAMSLIFFAEWGDRSQIATIGLAASDNALGVTLGALAAQAVCTGAAALGGRHLAAHVNERTVAFIGGALFMAFGCHALWEGPGHAATSN